MENESNNEQPQFNAIEAIEKLQGTDELNTLIDNQNKAYWSANIGNEVKTIYSSLDNSIKDVLGVDKPEDIKTSDWVKQNLSQLVETKKELEALKSKEDSNSELHKLHKQKVDKLNALIKEKDNQIISITQKGFENNISNSIDTLLVGKTFNSVYSESVLKDLVGLNKSRIVSNAKQTEKGTIYYDENGNAYLDALANPMTLDKVVDTVFSSLYQTTKAGGNTPTDQPTAPTEGNVIAVDMTSIKSKQDFFKEFQKQIAPKGLASHEKEYLEIQRATMEHYKINSLPLA
jgi:hypothetical protein